MWAVWRGDIGVRYMSTKKKRKKMMVMNVHTVQEKRTEKDLKSNLKAIIYRMRLTVPQLATGIGRGGAQSLEVNFLNLYRIRFFISGPELFADYAIYIYIYVVGTCGLKTPGMLTCTGLRRINYGSG